MGVMVSMLRGVNIGGHHKIPMAELRELYESLGYTGAVTLIQSGNVVFRTRERNEAAIAGRISDAIEGRWGFRPEVMLRSAAGIREVAARNPFAGRSGIEPDKLAVMFLQQDPGDEVRRKVAAVPVDPEEVRFEGRELWIYFPNGMGQSKAPAMIGKVLRMPTTGRNWNTVLKLVRIAEGMEKGPGQS